MFNTLPEPGSRWKSFTTSWGIQFLLLAAFLTFNALVPEALPEARRFIAVAFVSNPVEIPTAPQSIQHVVRLLPKPSPAFIVSQAPASHVEEVSAPVIKVAGPAPTPISTGSSVLPTLAKQPMKVQTGGFGDPNGLTAKTQLVPVNVAQAGGFEMPQGLGRGNGTGGAKGVPGVVMSTGFGNSTATGNSLRSTGGVVKTSGFDQMQAGGNKIHSTSYLVRTTPVEITFKPKPDYTAEARALKLEGDVVVEVVFNGNNQVEISRLIQGLGHGLDEQAVAAAKRINFKPATENGQPVSRRAIIRIKFLLA